jgi:Spy/CpxP family protein refolding chaperone
MSMAPAERNPKVISTLAFVFLAGMGCGALLMSTSLHDKLHRTVAAASVPPAQTSRDAVVQRFRTELNLTPDQTQQIAAVLDDYRHYYQSLSDQLDDVRSTGKNHILQILDPAQREKFEKMMNDLYPQLEAK